jgi:hypothetical protein
VDTRSEIREFLPYTAEPRLTSEEGLNLLASWAATLDQAETAHATDVA